MKDFPLFPTEYGMSSITLREIPYRKQAYIWIQSVAEGQLFPHLGECVRFCRMAGAERVLAANHPGLDKFPAYTTLLEMTGLGRSWEETAVRVPISKTTVGRWRTLYNERMSAVDGAGSLTYGDERSILEQGGACFVCRGAEALGIGWLSKGQVRAVASLIPGAGETVMACLMGAVPGQPLRLEVASTNERAIRLYRRLGFTVTRTLFTWYQIPEKFAKDAQTDAVFFDMYGKNT